jgi:hypothetical protein
MFLRGTEGTAVAHKIRSCDNVTTPWLLPRETQYDRHVLCLFCRCAVTESREGTRGASQEISGYQHTSHAASTPCRNAPHSRLIKIKQNLISAGQPPASNQKKRQKTGHERNQHTRGAAPRPKTTTTTRARSVAYCQSYPSRPVPATSRTSSTLALIDRPQHHPRRTITKPEEKEGGRRPDRPTKI